MSKFLDSNALKLMYNGIVQPCFDYSCSVWGNCSVKNEEILFRLLKRAARIITFNYDYETVNGSDLIKNLKLQTFKKRKNYFLSTLMFKCIHGLAPNRMCNNIEMTFDRHGFNTRAADSLNVVLPKPNLECFKKCFMYAGGKVWNSLQNTLKNSLSLSTFKTSYKKIYFN